MIKGCIWRIKAEHAKASESCYTYCHAGSVQSYSNHIVTLAIVTEY